MAVGYGGVETSGASEGLRRQWRADRALRPVMCSPGRPEPSRALQRRFWRVVAAGVTTTEAVTAVGVSVPVGARWFRHAGGMPPISLAEPGRAATRGGKVEYRATVAQWKAQEAAKRPKTAKLVTDPRLRDYVQDRLAGSVTRPDGTAVKGARHPGLEGIEQAPPGRSALVEGMEP